MISIRRITALLPIAFALNVLWELVQSPLYASHYSGLGQLLSVHVVASMGDMVMLAVIFVVTLRARSYGWVMAAGGTLAILVERYALATGRWAYGSAMPIIPLLDVGLMPILQMIVIPAVLILLTNRKIWNILTSLAD